MRLINWRYLNFRTLTVKYRYFVENWFVLVKVILDLLLIKILCLMQNQIESDFKKVIHVSLQCRDFEQFQELCKVSHLAFYLIFILYLIIFKSRSDQC